MKRPSPKLHKRITTDLSDLPVTETVLLQLFWIQRMLEFKRTNCTPISVPIYDSESKSWSFTILLNGNQADTINCNTIRDRSPCPPKSCEFKMIPRYVGTQVLYVKFEASLCGQLVGPAENSEAAFRFNSFWNRMNTGCPVINFGKTKDALDKVPHGKYYSALVSGPSHVDVCKEVKKHIQYSAYTCEEIQKVLRISADKHQRIFRMKLKDSIYLADIPWHMNEHSKLVNLLNSRSAKCKFNGYVQLNKTEEIREVPGHTSWLRFP
ncbi:unnamed protein product [Dicrocoelium dendriticum]|nr:unnamed protein product [Dicrocoelium dendriticum]